jgi:hypothetical protein
MLDEVELALCAAADPADISSVLRNFRFDQNHMIKGIGSHNYKS